MGLLVPLALALAALALPILVMYMLKLRREEQVVSSTWLWQQVLRDRQANAPWQRLRRHLLLLLQLLFLALLVLALARPYSDISERVQGHVVLLLDASASMQATDVAPSRFEAARSRARQIVDSLGANDTMTLIAVADVPRVLASLTHDRAILYQALAQAEAVDTEADWPAAAVLAAAGAQQARQATIVILSDGGLPDDLPPLPGQVRYVMVGSSAENRAITALAVREDQAFIRIANMGTQPAETLVQIEVDGLLYDARTLALEPRGSASIVLDDLPPDATILRVALAGEDPLALDDVAWAVRVPAAQQTALLVTTGNLFLERALDLAPNLDLVTIHVSQTATVTQIVPPVTPPALTVFDGVLPTVLPETGSLLLVDPPASTPLLTVGGTMTRTQIVYVEQDNPLLRYVDLDPVRIARAVQITPPSWARALVTAEGGALLLAGEVDGRRVAVLAFDLHQSNLPLQIAFPILVANLADWLAPAGAVDLPQGTESAPLHPGAPVVLRPQVDSEQLVITAPSGQQWHYEVGEAETISFAETDELGLYTVEEQRGDEARRAFFAVNLFSEWESDITPRETIAIGSEPVAGRSADQLGRREWWRWPALAGLALLVVEWFIYWRGTRRS